MILAVALQFKQMQSLQLSIISSLYILSHSDAVHMIIFLVTYFIPITHAFVCTPNTKNPLSHELF